MAAARGQGSGTGRIYSEMLTYVPKKNYKKITRELQGVSADSVVSELILSNRNIIGRLENKSGWFKNVFRDLQAK